MASVMEEGEAWQTYSCDDQASRYQGQTSVEQSVPHQAALRDVTGSHRDILRIIA